MIIGTAERDYWRKHKDSATVGTMLDNFHDFERTVVYEPMRPRWMPAENQPG